MFFLLAILDYLLQNRSITKHWLHITWARNTSRTSLAAVLLCFGHFCHTKLRAFLGQIQLQKSASFTMLLVRKESGSEIAALAKKSQVDVSDIVKRALQAAQFTTVRGLCFHWELWQYSCADQGSVT